MQKQTLKNIHNTYETTNRIANVAGDVHVCVNDCVCPASSAKCPYKINKNCKTGQINYTGQINKDCKTRYINKINRIIPIIPIIPFGHSIISHSYMEQTHTHTFRDGSNLYRLVYIPAGSFTMGANPNDSVASNDEKPAHSVTLSSFYIGYDEVPQWLWESVMGDNPSYKEEYYLPVVNVSWNDCQKFISRLSKFTGISFCLPTEAQWEYAARGGSQSNLYSGSNDIEEVAWLLDGNSVYYCVNEVGSKRPNAYGLYNMSGGVWEWCQDWYDEYSSLSQTNPIGPSSGTHRVIRGGSWQDTYDYCRVSCRNRAPSDFGGDFYGFRLALKTPGAQKTVDASDFKTPNAQKTVDVSDVKLYWDKSTNSIGYNGNSYKLVKVDGGTFDMGATSEQGRKAEEHEKPVHSVTLTNYFIGATEVPQWLWIAVMGSNPSNFKGDNLPVENVSWNDCQNFLLKLNAALGFNFALPTEAQWEYAARGGKRSCGYKYAGKFELKDVAWYFDSPGYGTHEVGGKEPNELGLYDMCGNVMEWCGDWYSLYRSSSLTDPTGPATGRYRVIRGGCWFSKDKDCRVSSRHLDSPDSNEVYLGFRLATQ